MDGLTPFPAPPTMPPAAPLPHLPQRLGRATRDPAAPGFSPRHGLALTRLFVFGLPLCATLCLGLWLYRRFATDGIGGVELALLGLLSLSFFWIAFAVGNALLGALWLIRRRRPAPGERHGPAVRPLRVALLVPIHNEEVATVFGNIHAMLAELSAAPTAHEFEIYILSDSGDRAIAEAEEAALATLRWNFPQSRIWYRRRKRNIGKKAGNIGDWVTRWGGRHEAMVVLDADSLMTAEALVALADRLAADPAAGLIQTSPDLIAAQTLFARMQAFATAVHGPPVARGLAAWTDGEGNYWGHNAILRTRAFAATAGLPPMPGLGRAGGLILSHDFVEAALMRRAGWAVRFAPEIAGSHEAPPATLIDYALRDRRWCHGNLQHLVLMVMTRGLHPISRFHLLQGGMSYLLAPAWFALVVIWALLGNGEASVVSYFSEADPLRPVWPQMHPAGSLAMLGLMYAMLLAPKFVGLLGLPLRRAGRALSGRWAGLVGNTLAEAVLAILYAPILMVQQCLAVARTCLGFRPRWHAPRRSGGRYRWRAVLRFHALETAIGLGLAAGMAAGVVSPWLLPIAVSLTLAVPLSLGSGLRLSGGLLRLPGDAGAPAIEAHARAARPLYETGARPPLAAE